MMGSSVQFKSCYAACEYATDSKLLPDMFHNSYHLLTCICSLSMLVNVPTTDAAAVLYITAGRSCVGCRSCSYIQVCREG